MTTTKKRFETLLVQHASWATYHRDDSTSPCPCRTPEGVRDPIWHLENPHERECNEAGFLPDNPIHMQVKGFLQPIQSTRATRLSTEQLLQMFGDIQADDHLAIFPVAWDGVTLNFRNWSPSGEDYIVYADQRFTVVNANLIPTPDTGEAYGHWEVGLRKISEEPLV
jgi:hypothetical protein